MDKEKIKAQFKEEMLDLIEFMQTFITEEKRMYPDKLTIRKEGVGVTGKEARTPRDVVDTGELRDSLGEPEIEETENSITITAKWTSDHSEDVYMGQGSIPPYPWVELALRETKYSEILS